MISTGAEVRAGWARESGSYPSTSMRAILLADVVNDGETRVSTPCTLSPRGIGVTRAGRTSRTRPMSISSIGARRIDDRGSQLEPGWPAPPTPDLTGGAPEPAKGADTARIELVLS